MTLLDRHLCARLVSAFLKTLLALVVLFIAIDLLTHRRTEIMRHDVPWTGVVTYYVVFVPQILYRYQVTALAVLVASLLVLGNAAQHNEIIAAHAGGVSLRRLMRWPVLAALALAATLLVFQESLGVMGTRACERIEKKYFPRDHYVLRGPVSWPSLEDGWTCHILKFNRVALTGESVFMLSIRDNVVEQIQANRIFWDEDRREWLLEDGYWLEFDTQETWACTSTVVRQRPAPISATPEALFALERPPETKSAVQLWTDIRRASARGVPTQRQQVDFHAKFAQPALAFVMIWLAIPFALRIRRGGLAIGFGVSVAIAVAYLMVFRLSMGMGYYGHFTPLVAAWLPNGLFLAFGITLSNTARA